MGHSLGGPDDLYYEQYLIPILKNAHWVFFYHNNDRKEKEDFAQKHSLKNVEFIHW